MLCLLKKAKMNTSMDKSELEKILRQVQKPARYTGGEWNEIKKDPRRVKVKVALAFPDLYEIGMSYLGQKILYSLLNARPSILAERVFSPWIDLEKELRERKTPLFSLENKIPLYEFDILGFSLLYELNYSNILTILELGRIPLLSRQRDLHYPLVIAGGPAAFNPEPLADIFDLFLIGDGEEAFLEIVEKFVALKEETNDKNALLQEMAKIRGIYVPSFYTTYRPPGSSLLAVKAGDKAPALVEKRVYSLFHQSTFPDKTIVPHIKVIFDRVAVEAARGCPQNCRFCQATSIYFPYRVKSPDLVVENVLRNLLSTGYEDASLAALSICDYPYFHKVLEALMGILEKQKISLSLSALRPEGLSGEVAKNIIRVRKTGFTLVPEAGTERLRCVINKNLKDIDIWEASRSAFVHGWKLLKLYFMVGLPTEKEEDLEGIIDIIKEIVSIGYKILKKAPQINLSVSSFIPKPHTPFQWVKMEDSEVLQEKHRYLVSMLKRYPFVRYKGQAISSTILEAIFSRGDRNLSSVLLNSWKNGVRFDSWDEMLKFSIWEKSFEAESLDYHRYLSRLERDIVLPWDHISAGIKKFHLLHELDDALNEKRSKSCLERKCGLCLGCYLPAHYEKNFSEKLGSSPKDFPLYGEKTEEIFRYRAFYRKIHMARFISHRDVSHIIQRALRRASIPVVHSKGFHPKMIISYLPALPLGMEGKFEVCEFKSSFLFSEKDFLSHVNKFLPKGIRFFKLIKLGSQQPSLTKDIKSLVYSVKWKSHEMKKALEAADNRRSINDLIFEFKRKFMAETLLKLKFYKKQEKLFLYFRFSPQKIARPQEMIKKIFGLENSVYLMTREKVVFKS